MTTPTPEHATRLQADRLYWYGTEHQCWPLVEFVACHRMRRHTPIKEHRLRVHEVVLVESGALQLKINRKTIKITARQGTIIPPESLITHAGAPNSGTVFWIGLRDPRKHDLGVSFVAGEVEKLFTHLRRFKATPFPVSDALLDAAREVFERVQSGAPRLAKFAAEAEFTAHLMQCLESPVTPAASDESALLAPAFAALLEGPPAGLPVDSLARLCHMSRTTFNAMFKRVTGMTPRLWVNRRRIESAANELVRSNCAVHDIAARFGFVTSQHFATMFKAVMGASPTDYRAERTKTDSA